MCGILGAFPSINNDHFRNGLKMIAHRGPDGEGLWNDENHVQLGHRRLSIIDLTDAGNQPMHFEDLTLVFNGEIYNYVEVREELKKKGYHFITQSDSEVLLKAYHCWGRHCLEKFNGMWAFAIYNRVAKEIFIARDRYGVKPLYYYNNGKQFFFASEIKAIQRLLGSDYLLNKDVLVNLVRGGFDWHGGHATWLKDVDILPAGSFLKVKQGSLEEFHWYELVEQEVTCNFNEQAEMLQSLLKDACKIRLRSDVPIGTCLSGGLDSSSITSLINSEVGNYTHKSFCASFPNTPIDEAAKATELVKQLNSSLSIVSILPPTVQELEKSMTQCDGPMHALAFYPIWKLYQFIKEAGIKVTLDGQGPDEMMGGYRPIASALRFAFRNMDLKYMLDIYNVYRAQGETDQASSKKYAKHQFVETIKSEIKRPVSLLLGRQRIKKYEHPFRSNELDEEFYQEFFRSPLPGILQQYDRCSMAHGVECRMPFMDYRVVEFLFSLPVNSKIGDGYTKRVLRQAMKDIVPDSIRLDKTKIGFNAPIVNWYSGPLKEWMLDIMSTQDYQTADLFNGKEIKENFEKFVADDKPLWSTAWGFWGSVHYVWWKEKMTSEWI